METDEGRRVQAGKKVLLEAVTPDLVELESSWAREVSGFAAFRKIEGLIDGSLCDISYGSLVYMLVSFSSLGLRSGVIKTR